MFYNSSWNGKDDKIKRKKGIAVVRGITGFRAWTNFISALYLPIGGYCQAIQHGLSFLS